MGFWTGIKRALNSTLGTANFKPLDKWITEQTRMIVSDDVYENLADFVLSAEAHSTVQGYHPAKLKMSRVGTFRVSGKTSLLNHEDLKFIVYKNGSEYYSAIMSGDVSAYPSINVDVPFLVGDEIAFYFGFTNYTNIKRNFVLSEFQIKGKIINNIYEVIE